VTHPSYWPVQRIIQIGAETSVEVTMERMSFKEVSIPSHTAIVILNPDPRWDVDIYTLKSQYLRYMRQLGFPDSEVSFIIGLDGLLEGFHEAKVVVYSGHGSPSTWGELRHGVWRHVTAQEIAKHLKCELLISCACLNGREMARELIALGVSRCVIACTRVTEVREDAKLFNTLSSLSAYEACVAMDVHYLCTVPLPEDVPWHYRCGAWVCFGDSSYRVPRASLFSIYSIAMVSDMLQYDTILVATMLTAVLLLVLFAERRMLK